MGRRINLQAPVSISGGDEQDTRDAQRVQGGARSGFAMINVFNVSAAVDLTIHTASDLNLDSAMGTGGFWAPAGATTTGLITGVNTISLSELGDWVRWSTTGSGKARFSIVIFAYDA